MITAEFGNDNHLLILECFLGRRHYLRLFGETPDAWFLFGGCHRTFGRTDESVIPVRKRLDIVVGRSLRINAANALRASTEYSLKDYLRGR